MNRIPGIFSSQTLHGALGVPLIFCLSLLTLGAPQAQAGMTSFNPSSARVRHSPQAPLRWAEAPGMPPRSHSRFGLNPGPMSPSSDAASQQEESLTPCALPPGSQPLTALGPRPRNNPKGMNLPSGWYVIASSLDLQEGQLLGVQRFNEPLVIWKKQGQLSVFQDRCPHRHAKLSQGKVGLLGLQCRYHGIEFNSQGRAEWIPELGRGAPLLCVQQYPAVEKDGWIWAYWGSNPSVPPLASEPPSASIETQNLIYTTLVKRTWKTHITRAIESQLDYAHLPTVHTILGQFSPNARTHPTIIESQEHIRWYFDSPESYAELQLPNLWTLVLPGGLVLKIAFAPIDAETTEILAQSGYRKWGDNAYLDSLSERGVHDPFLHWISQAWTSHVLSEDQSVVETQRPLDSRDARSEVLLKSDALIQWYRNRMQIQSSVTRSEDSDPELF
ncbi:MAG: Rieske 2Fe-2S domain-containing protein [Bdellovibrionia bacterium]